MIRPRRNNYLRILLLIAFFALATYLISPYSFHTIAQEEPPTSSEETEIMDTQPPSVPVRLFPPPPLYRPVSVINSQNFYVEWEPAEDNVTLPENMTYLYIPYQFGLLPILEEPFTYVGTTRHPETGYDTDFMEGIYWYTVIAIDEAGNTSEPDGGHTTTQFIIDNSPPNKVEGVNIYKGYTSDTENLLGCSTYINNPEFRIQWQKTEDTWNPLEEPHTDYNYLVTHYLLTLKPDDTEPDSEQIPEETEQPAEEITDPWEIKVEETYYDISEDDLVSGKNTYDFVVTAVDMGGNEGEMSESCTLILDPERPTTTITSPPNNHIGKDPLAISGYSTDDYTVDTVSLYYTTYDLATSLCSEEWNSLTTKQILDKEAAPFNWSHYEYSLEDGIYCLKAQSKDLAQNTEDFDTAPVVENIMYDTTRPVIDSINISEERILQSISTYDNLSDIKNIEMRVGSTTQWTTYLEGEALDPLVSNEPGTHTLYIRVTDNAGNEQVKSASFTIPSPPSPPEEPEEPVLGANTSTTTEGTNNSNTETNTTTTETITDTNQETQESEERINNEIPEEEEIVEMDGNPMLTEQTDINTNNYPQDYTPGEVKGESTDNKNNGMLWISLVIIIPLFVIFIALLTRKGEENK